MGTQQFCLRWNNHQSNMLNTFESLLHNEALVDVTLACDGLSLKAHKVVLSACSPYFQSLFIENPCKHPIVILKDVRYTDLKALVDFMYKGEVNVSQEQLNALLNTAEALKIKGLAEVTGGGFSCVNSTQLEPLSLSRTQGPRDPPTPPLVESRRSQPPPLPHLQPLPNPPGMVPIAPASPPPKRRKTKPRKRIPESAIISDQEDSDAVDLVTTTPEMIETCVDIPESSSEGERVMEPTETKNVPLLEQPRSNEAENSQHHPPPSLPPPPPPPPPLPPSAIASAEGTDDRNPQGETKVFHKLFSNTNQNQTAACVSSPSTLPTQRLPMLSKSSLISVLPPSSSSPVPSTSTTQATIQDPAGWPERKRREYHCEHCQMSFESKKVFYKHGCPRVRVGFTCEVCGSYFPTHCRYSRHKQIHNPDREIYTCYYCPKTMVRMDHLKQHMKNAHGTL